MSVPFGVSSMVAPLRHVLMQRPTAAFGRAFDDPACGYLRPVALDIARKEHDQFAEALSNLGPTVHELGADSPYPDQVFTYDPALVTARGAILLRSGKPGRRGEEEILGDWFKRNGIPIVGRIVGPGTVDGGDVMWLRPDVLCVGRSLRTNQAGIEQLAEFVGGELQVFDVPYDEGPAACLHLMSSLSMIADDLAVVERPRLPSGLYSLLADLEVTMIDVAPEEVHTLATNVLAIRPGVVMMLQGNPITRRSLAAAGVEVHTFVGEEIAINGTGGATCLTRPVQRA